MLRQLSQNPEEVCASNLIFLGSRAANDIKYALAKDCWPIHEAIINLVRPKLILTFGNSKTSPYEYIKSKFSAEEIYNESSGHGNWRTKGFSTTLNGKKLYVAGVPHLSRYDPVGKNDVLNWLKKSLLE